MKKHLLLCLFLLAGPAVFGQDKPAAVPKTQFLLIVRSKTDCSKISPDSIQSNIKHWQAYMGNLAQNGKIAGGYRPGADGLTIAGVKKSISSGAYKANDEIVSSFLIINAVDLEEAKSIALKCPVFELGGNVEVRPMQETAR
jgi:hypothetical protein